MRFKKKITFIFKLGTMGIFGAHGPLLEAPLQVNQTVLANTLWVWLRGDVTA